MIKMPICFFLCMQMLHQQAKKLSMKGLETFFLSPDRSERSKNVAALENQSDMEEMDFYSKGLS